MPPLPSELWDTIIDWVDSKRALLNCALVCRAWHAHALRRVYQSLAVHVTAGQRATEVEPDETLKLSAVAFRHLIDRASMALPMIQALRYDLTFHAQISPELEGLLFPSTIQVASLHLRYLHLWGENNRDLLLTSNFARITSLELNPASIESLAVFAAAMADFPLLRNLWFCGSIVRPKFDVGIAPPRFAQPCNLRVDAWQLPTWSAILQWTLLDIARIGRMSLANPMAMQVLLDYLPSNPEFGSHVHDIAADYIPGQEERWKALDAALSHLTRLHTLRVQTFDSTHGAGPEQPGLLDKVAAVAQRQAEISSSLRVVLLDVPEHLLTAANADAQDAVARFDTALSRLRSLSRVGIRLFARQSSRIWDNDPALVKSYSQKLPLLEQSGHLVVALPGWGHPE